MCFLQVWPQPYFQDLAFVFPFASMTTKPRIPKYSCPVSIVPPWPLYHDLVHPGQRTPLMLEDEEVPESLAWRFSRHNQKKEIK